MIANADSIPRMLSMCKRMHAESRYSHLDYSEEKMAALIWSLLRHPTGIVLEQPNGLLLGIVDEYWFGRDKYAYEMLLYVEPAFRGSPQAVRLVQAYIDRAKVFGAKDIHIENTTGIQTEGIENFFQRMGFGRVGGNFLMEV